MKCICGHPKSDHRSMPAIGKGQNPAEKEWTQHVGPWPRDTQPICWFILSTDEKEGYYIRRNYCPCMGYTEE